jgi:lysine 2,3-aminomutase
MEKKLSDIIRSSNYDVYRILKNSEDLPSARAMLMLYLTNCELAVEGTRQSLHSLEISLIRDCIMAFRNMLKPRSERLAEFSVLQCLYDAVSNGKQQFDYPITRAFLEEIRHLLRGITGRVKLYDLESVAQYLYKNGREAAIERSNDLDTMGEYALSYINRYATGLDAEVKNRRAENRKRVLAHFKGSVEDWENYKWHIRHVIRDSETLGALVTLTKQEKEGIDLAVKNNVPFGVTPYYASLMDVDPSRACDHAVRAQVIPPLDYVEKMIEGRRRGDSSLDFMLERDTSPIDNVTRRYPMIVVFKPYNSCAQICVYCQRNWEIERVLCDHAIISNEKLEAALSWLKQRPAIREVLVTGGDPFILGDAYLDRLMASLSAIPHIERIRLGTRTPVVLPQRITPKLVSILSKYFEPGHREVCLVTHYEHVYEITEESIEAIDRFRKKGIALFNQLVYTVETSRRFESAALRRLLRLIGVVPYYTFNTKGKEETSRYRVPIARLLQEQKEEARLLTGVMRTDEAVYNVPRLGKNYLRAGQHHSLISVLPDGSRVYEFHPWEKKIALADTFIARDVPIYDYLMDLKRRGENIKDYESIWYYF